MAFGWDCACQIQRGDSIGEEVVDAEMQRINAEAERILEAERQEVESIWQLRRAKSPTEAQVEMLSTMEDTEAGQGVQLSQAVPEPIQEEPEQEAKAEAKVGEAQASEAAEKPSGEEERQKAVAAFLKKHGFKDVKSVKKSLLSGSTYVLHKACKLGDARMVEYLLEEGASKDQKDSHGRTPADIAKASKNSAVLQALGCELTAARGGA
mmetsp:Transcript_62157/g.116282  ORF Transcript_62157/g.116282 Transcript_62157/m.116282 type:complete len:209 (+) Transcript_62157:76-702(+)